MENLKRSITTEYEYGKENYPIHIHPAMFLTFDNSYPITIALKPEFQGDGCYAFETKLIAYAKQRQIQLKLYVEHETTNTHYHGYVGYPTDKARINFVKFINRYGKYFVSKQHENSDMSGWVRYCEKKEELSVIDLTQFRYNNYFDIPPLPRPNINLVIPPATPRPTPRRFDFPKEINKDFILPEASDD